MPDPYPTFGTCPQCSGMLWSDGDGQWCEDCEWGEAQRDLFTDQAEADA